MLNALLSTVDMSFVNNGLDWQIYLGQARTEDGLVLNGIFHRKFKQTEQTLVYVKGHRHCRYSYPLIDRSFSSPMINDYNLCFVGGWTAVDQNGLRLDTNSLAVARVIEGLKPMCWCHARKVFPDRVDELKLLEKQASAAGLATLITETEDQFCLSVCHVGEFDEMFDLDSLHRDYIEFRKKIRTFMRDDIFIEWFRDAFEKMRGKYLEEYINWINEPEVGRNYYLLTGLFLGFPHETTYSLMME